MYVFVQNSVVQAYPYSIGEFRQQHPNVSLPAAPTVAQLEEQGLFLVIPETPVFDPVTQTATEVSPIKVGGFWTQQWQVTSLDSSTIASNLSATKASQWLRIQSKRTLLSDTGGYQVNGKWFHSDAKSKVQQLSLVMMGANVPAVPWKTMDGSFVTMTPTLASQIFQSAAAQDMAIFQAAEVHKATMEASTDPASYNFDAGWPLTYQG